jgi:NAD-dependent deacetylase
MLRNAREVVVFTGAGVSAESGIATFRDEDGFWQRFPPEDFANWAGLLKTAAVHPRRFTEFLLAVLEPIARADPNAGHRAIAALEQHVNVTVVTQNIDGLHQAAGSTVVKEIHGTLFELVSTPGNRFLRLVTRGELLEIIEGLHEALESRATAVKAPVAIRSIFGPGAGVVIIRAMRCLEFSWKNWSAGMISSSPSS